MRHKSEWSVGQAGKFEELKALIRKHKCAEEAERLGKRIADLGITLKGEGFDSEREAYYIHPLGMIGWLTVAGCQCGKKLINAIKCTRYKTKVMTQYGPTYKGYQPLSSYTHWNRLISEGKVSQDESQILIAMSENEGNFDAVQSYDSEILTAGAMQKTINPLGEGELPIQMNKFKEQFPQLFDKYFRCCGWDVRLKSGKYVAYYNDFTGAELKAIIRNGYTADTYGKFVPNKAVAIFAEAIDIDEYKEIQVLDFIDRLHLALNIVPEGYSYKIASYVRSNLGRATVLDHHVNRPNNVSKYFGIALDYFFSKNPNISKNPDTWGELHNKYENEIINFYGVNRNGTDMPKRYVELKKKL
ncbi:calcium-binding protein [Aggregatibacter actinomycetemcomitans]|uniref:calcium-binding protein n=1 Tax=Aggregatibacter actinomycetemcomitans TaxID=714 RepID=UPI00211E950E|nr:calcium-binding protein [Aggregatibacter actinomycetemcomitans]